MVLFGKQLSSSTCQIKITRFSLFFLSLFASNFIYIYGAILKIAVNIINAGYEKLHNKNVLFWIASEICWQLRTCCVFSDTHFSVLFYFYVLKTKGELKNRNCRHIQCQKHQITTVLGQSKSSLSESMFSNCQLLPEYCYVGNEGHAQTTPASVTRTGGWSTFPDIHRTLFYSGAICWSRLLELRLSSEMIRGLEGS